MSKTKATMAIKQKIKNKSINTSSPLKLKPDNLPNKQKASSLIASQVIAKANKKVESTKKSKLAKTDKKMADSEIKELKSDDKTKKVVIERTKDFEAVLLAELNKYRKENKNTELQRTDFCDKEIEEICTASLKKGKIDEKTHKLHNKTITAKNFMSQTPFYIEGMNKSLNTDLAFVTYVLGKWKSRPKVDTDIKAKEAAKCGLVVMKSEKDICVFMAVYKG